MTDHTTARKLIHVVDTPKYTSESSLIGAKVFHIALFMHDNKQYIASIPKRARSGPIVAIAMLDMDGEVSHSLGATSLLAASPLDHSECYMGTPYLLNC